MLQLPFRVRPATPASHPPVSADRLITGYSRLCARSVSSPKQAGKSDLLRIASPRRGLPALPSNSLQIANQVRVILIERP